MFNGSSPSAAVRAQNLAMNPLSTLEVESDDDEGSVVRPDDQPPAQQYGSDSDAASSTTPSYAGTTSSDNSSNANRITTRVEKLALGQIESRYVACLRLGVLAAMIVSGVFMSRATYRFVVREQESDFEDQFADITERFVDDSIERAQTILLALRTAAVAVTSEARAKNEEWPFVTIPHFELKGRNLMEQTGAESMFMSVLVVDDQRDAWETYSTENQDWLQDGLLFQGRAVKSPEIIPYIHNLTSNPNGLGFMRDPGPGLYIPMWQRSPAPYGSDVAFLNYNLRTGDDFDSDFRAIRKTKQAVISKALARTTRNPMPRSVLHQAIFSETGNRGDLVGLLSATIPWDLYFRDRVPNGTNPIFLLLSGSCNQSFTYVVTGPEVEYVGEGDLHETKFDYLEVDRDFSPFDNIVKDEYNQTEAVGCQWSVRLYPSSELRAGFDSNQPTLFTSGVSVLFGLIIVCFVTYDCCVERRQRQNVSTATKSNAIISSLFPAQVRDRLLAGAADVGHGKDAISPSASKALQGSKIPTELSSKPIADLFPNCTVLFADIVGFTAWSSVREPVQVFILLESLYHNFDNIAHQRRVFKVETIGDCYVAVTGLPEPRKNHAVVMARFANACLVKMKKIVAKLEVTLGPDTGDLSMRMGLHSGQVTAGVLRGEKSRFQLFGDTVNTAARIESTGSRGKIQISQETADLLINDGKSRWVKPRDRRIQAKGKGELQTYWLDIKAASISSDPTSDPTSHETEHDVDASESPATPDVIEPEAAVPDDEVVILDSRIKRLVDWNIDVLRQQLKKIVAMRNPNLQKDPFEAAKINPDGTTVLDEVLEIITLPSQVATYEQGDLKGVQLDEEVRLQLQAFVTKIATWYRDVPFHNFDHASHVTMSVTKLLSRVVTPSDIDYKRRDSLTENGTNLHEYTYGITSDPLTQFAVSFSALIHDVDHYGVPNAQLVKENTEAAKKYRNKSVAEQNSVDLAWGLLMQPQFRELRECICYTKSEQQRFRQLVVNAVMATDIVDKELGALRKQRWEKAFHEGPGSEVSSDEDNRNRKATIVIEHLIQASDVAHTMQHWHVYQKWNERFFRECRQAYLDGKAEKDPAIGWYQGELGFFDFYIIPLAKKLKECGCFGISSDEYLNYAVANRKEWERKGKAIVDGYISAYEDSQEDSGVKVAPAEVAPGE